MSDVSILSTLDPQTVFEGRENKRKAFLAQNGYKSSMILPLTEDGSFRRYYRVNSTGDFAILMDSVPELETIWASSHRLKDYVPIAKALRSVGISAPEIYASDIENGFCLMEDLGKDSYQHRLQNGHGERDLFEHAVGVLEVFRDNPKLNALPLQNFFNTGVFERKDQICTWYYPALTGQIMSPALKSDFDSAWDKIMDDLPDIEMCFQHGDFHIDNLTYLEDREGIQKCGIFDFQGAIEGPMPYDLVNLLEDARRSMEPAMKAGLKDQYCKGFSPEERENFDAWYTVLSAIFHCRVIGYFTQVYVRDNKDQYLEHLPRMRAYIQSTLETDIMKPLKEWFDMSNLSLSQPLPHFDIEEIKALIGNIA